MPCEKRALTVAVDSVSLEDKNAGITSIDASVVKDAGDDPDVTHGARVGVHVTIEKCNQNQVIIKGGPGVGKVTRPGLPVAVGEPAINPVPRKMITHEVLRRLPDTGTFKVTVRVYVENGNQ